MRYRFGEFELDTEAYALTRGGQAQHLRPKVFDLLRFLIERRGRIVTKEELQDALWEVEHVSEGVVPWSVNHARRALGQRAHDTQPMIETLYGRGYRWRAEVEVIHDRSSRPPRPEPRPEPPQPADEQPFVGRAEVMSRLRQRLEQAHARSGGLIVLVGEPGIGKTRCMDELAASAASLGFCAWSGRAIEDRWAPAFWPWTQVVRAAAEERGLRERASAVLAQLNAVASPSAAREPSRDAEPQPERFMLLDAIGRFLFQASRRRPLLVLLDDLHWADAATLGLIATLAPELRRHALLIVSSERDWLQGSRVRRPPQLDRYAERIDLQPLTTRDVAQYIELVTHGAAPEALSTAVHNVTAGNALFLQETVRTLIAQHGASRLASLSPAEVKPAQLARNVLRERLDTLDHATYSVLSTASVLGESFDTDLLQGVTGIAIEGVISALEVGVRAGLLSAEGANRYRFCHALVRHVLYDGVPAHVRISAHRMAAVALERMAHIAPRHGELAHHYYRSLALGQAGAVSAAAHRAAEEAVRTGEFEDAVTFCQWALESQALDLDAAPRQRAELLLLHARSARHAGRARDALAAIGKLVEVGCQHGLADLLVRAGRVMRPGRTWLAFAEPTVRVALEETLRISPDESDENRISALSQIASVLPYAADMERSKALSAEAVRLARKAGKPALLAEALRARLYALSGPDDLDALFEVANEMLALDGEAASWISIAAHSACYGASIHRGDDAGAERALTALGDTAREQRRPEALWYHDRLRAQRRFMEGDFAAAEAAFAELEGMRLNYRAWMFRVPQALLALDCVGSAAATQWDLLGLSSRAKDMAPEAAGLARVAVRIGREDIARPVLERWSARELSGVPKDIGYLNALSNLSLVAIALGDRANAEALYARLAPYPRHNTPSGLMYYEGSVSHYLALLAELLGQRDRARSHFEDALAMNESLSHKAQLARTYFEYARFLLGAKGGGSHDRARQMQAQCAELASKLGMHALEERARAL